MMLHKKKTVFVGLSGGVDSSVAALRLLNEGYSVVGVFIKVWHPSFLECNWEQERLDAMRVAAKLGIPFLTCDAEQAYKDDVADYFIAEYRKGTTPNPDVMCNKYVKFGAFLQFAEAHNADFIATGHYAQKREAKGKYELLRGADTNKDQSYFLWTLTQEQLARVLLPVGASEKSVIREEAEKAGLITARKKDSQGICFLGHIDIPDFLSHYVDLVPGAVLNEDKERIGTHKGALVYTVGQRHGFIIESKDPARSAYYVISRDLQANTITVSDSKPVQKANGTLVLTDTNYIGWEPAAHDVVELQTRYRQNPTKAKVVQIGQNGLSLEFIEESEGVGAGQSCVLYRARQCIGGGIIS